MVAISYTPNFKDVIQACLIEVSEREPQALASIWQYGTALTLTGGQVKRFRIRASDPFLNATIPSPFGTNAVQTLTASAPLDDGSFVGSFRNEQFTINWDDDNAAIQAALVALSTIGVDSGGIDNVLVGGGPFKDAPITVMFRGTLKWQDVELIAIVSSNLNTVSSPATIEIVETTPIGVGVNQTFTGTPSATPITSGSVKFQSGSVKTPTILSPQ